MGKLTNTIKVARKGKHDTTEVREIDYDFVNFNCYFLDLIYDVLNENKKLRDLGFFAEVRHSGEDEYNSKNKYRLLNEKHKTFKGASDSLRQRINEELNVFINNYYIMKVTYNNGFLIDGIFSALSNQFTTMSLNGMFYNDSSYTVLTGNYNAINSVFVDTLLEKEVENLLRISDTIAKKLSANKLAGDISISDSLSIELNNCINYLRHIRAVAKSDLTNDDLLYVREKALPLFLQLNLIYGTGQQYIDDMRKLINFVYAKNVYRVKKELAMLNLSKGLSGVPLNKLYDFVKLLTELNKLDKANTYDYVFNTIKQVSTVLPDGKAKKYLSVLTDNVERFAFINKEENKIEIDVEEILLQLYKRYAEQNNSNVKFYLSLGLNQTLNIHYNKGNEILTDNNDPDSKLKSLAFASEKIGIKWEMVQFPRKKIKDNESKLSYKNTNPYFKDLHLILFGSGLLYNVVNTTTSKNFDAMLTGFAAGTSFYNGLDVNLFMAFPLLFNESFGKSVSRRHMFGFSMDIKFMEYIDALRKKRAEQKNKP
ncbi:MAG TPA: hypothetical protein PKN75_07530 [Bacteroidia bacterium]|nr:hypothetical protein [Bacteroidia bacterium]HNU33429.1 hypothetical protein [Bacteroidia bacterium]